MKMKKMFPLVLMMSATGCASAVHRGVVAMKLDDRKAHVGIGGKEVAVGDHVELYRNQCESGGSARQGGTRSCTKTSTGHGVVSKVLSSDYSEVSFDPGVEFHEGDTVEKHDH
jgi:hypothetical protein